MFEEKFDSDVFFFTIVKVVVVIISTTKNLINTKSRFWSKKNLNFEAKIKILGFSMLAISDF